MKISDHELGMLKEAVRSNDHAEGFRSYVPMAAGSFARINLEKRATSLLSKGLFAKTAHGYELTAAGRAAIKSKDSDQ